MRTVSRYEVSAFRPVILAYLGPCVLPTAPKRFAFGEQRWHKVRSLQVAPHRLDYSREDAQAVCDMLNARLPYIKQASLAAAPSGGERGVSPSFPCADDGAPELDNCTAAKALTANESY